MWAFIFGFPFGVGSFNAKSYLMYSCYVKLCANLFYGLLDRIRTIKVRYDLHSKNKIFTSLPNSSNSESPLARRSLTRPVLPPTTIPCFLPQWPVSKRSFKSTADILFLTYEIIHTKFLEHFLLKKNYCSSYVCYWHYFPILCFLILPCKDRQLLIMSYWIL